MNPPPEVGSTTAGVKEEETHLAGAPIAPPPPRFSSPPAVMPVTAAVAAAKAVAAEMLAAPIAETPGREWRVDAMDADPAPPRATSTARCTSSRDGRRTRTTGGSRPAMARSARARPARRRRSHPRATTRPSTPSLSRSATPRLLPPRWTPRFARPPAHRRGGGRRVGRHVRPPHGRVHRRPVGRVRELGRVRRRVVRQVAKGASCGGASHL